MTSIETGHTPDQKELPQQPFPSSEIIYREIFKALMLNADLRNDSIDTTLFNFTMGTFSTAILWGHRKLMGEHAIDQIRRNEAERLESGLSETVPPDEPYVAEAVQEAIDSEYPMPHVGRIRRIIDRIKYTFHFGRTPEQPIPENVSAHGWEAKLAGEETLTKNYGEKLQDDPTCRTPERRAAKLIHATARLYTRLSDPETSEQTVVEINEKNRLDPNWFKKVFAVRIPEKKADVVKENSSDYIVVTGGTPEGERWMYKVQVVRDGVAIPAEELEETIKAIADREKTERELQSGLRRRWGKKKPIGQTYSPLTYMPRRELYKVNQELAKDPANKAALETYQNALFAVSIIDDSFSSYADAMQYGVMGYRKDGQNNITANAMFTPNDMGLTYVIDSKGSCVAKAEHLIADGSPHELLVNKANQIATEYQMRRGYETQKAGVAERVEWNIPDRTIASAEKTFTKSAQERTVDFAEIESAGADEFGKRWADSYIQMATQLAHASTRMAVMRAKGKEPKLRDVLDFYATEPVKLTQYKGGRLSIAQVKTSEMQDLMYEILTNPDSESIGDLVRAAATSINKEVGKARLGNAFLTHLMAITAAHHMGDPVKAAAYMRVMEKIFVTLNPRIKKLFRAELLSSNGVRSDQVKYLEGFTTVEALSHSGITVGYIPGINGVPSRFYVRGCGEFADYTEFYKKELKRYLELVKQHPQPAAVEKATEVVEVVEEEKALEFGA